ncbi:MAG: DUF4838 domain-containing protein, partial [Verrucomicrobiota bacterium]
MQQTNTLLMATGCLALLAVGGCKPAVKVADAPPLAPLKLAENGISTAVIVLKKDTATEAETFAAEELKGYLHRITGANFPIVDEKSVGGAEKKIFVGKTAFSQANGVEYAHLNQEEWILKTAGDNLILSGGRPRGTLYAVYEFLEKYGGCSWLDQRTEVVPQHKTFVIPEMNEKSKPAFLGREIYTEYMSDGNGFLVKNKINSQVWENSKYGYQAARYGSPGTSHTMYAYAKDWPRQYPDHPEYFAMTEAGGRLVPITGAVNGMLICTSNPDVRELILQGLIGYIEKDRAAAKSAGCPPPTIYSISQNDDNGYCVCPKCKTMLEREGSFSGVLLDFINEIARKIKIKYPDIYIHTLAYTFTLEPPKLIKAEDNVIVQVCNLGSEWYPLACAEHLRSVLHEDNKHFHDILNRWSKVANHLAIWDYWSIYKSQQVPYCNVSTIQPDLKYYHDKKVELFFTQAGDDLTRMSFTALKEWLGFKMLQNPDRPARGLINLFMRGYYGAAANEMVEYLDYLELRIAQTPGLYGRLKVRDWAYLDLPFFVKTNAILDSAETLVADNPLYSLHVLRERIPVDFALLYLWDKLAGKTPEAAKLPFDREMILNRYEKNRKDVINCIYKGGKKGDLELEKFACEIKLLKNPPLLPEQFKGKEIVDFLWPDFNSRAIDSDAAGGMAFRLGQKGTTDGVPDHNKPLTIGVYDQTNKKSGPQITIQKQNVPQDGMYH